MSTEQSSLIKKIDWDKSAGLVPCIVQDSSTRAVLMLGYMNSESISKTYDSGKVTFFSRSKNRLWEKGETSGNYLEFVSASIDCDNDALLILAKPAGPTCHTGSASCFDQPGSESNISSASWLGELELLIEERSEAPIEESYTAGLLAEGSKRVAQKVGEEGLEVALAAATNDREEVISESADLVFHLLVLLKDHDVSLSEVVVELQSRNKH